MFVSDVTAAKKIMREGGTSNSFIFLLPGLEKFVLDFAVVNNVMRERV